MLEARALSYSSDFWTDRVYVKSDTYPAWDNIYWLGNLSDDYFPLGDPYTVYIPKELVIPGENNSIRIGTGLSPINATGGSPDDKVVYKVRISDITLDGYSDVFPKASGSTNTLYYDTDGNNVYDGYIVVSVGPNPSDSFDPQNDSIDDAFMRLIDGLNFLFDVNETSYGNGTVINPYDGINQSNPLDLQLNTEIEFETGSIQGIQTLWGPVSIEIRMWV